LNDALFALQKTKSKATGDQAIELKYHEAQVRFVANFLLSRLPEGELSPEDDASGDD
jgi:hypothetical protein